MGSRTRALAGDCTRQFAAIGVYTRAAIGSLTCGYGLGAHMSPKQAKRAKTGVQGRGGGVGNNALPAHAQVRLAGVTGESKYVGARALHLCLSRGLSRVSSM